MSLCRKEVLLKAVILVMPTYVNPISDYPSNYAIYWQHNGKIMLLKN